MHPVLFILMSVSIQAFSFAYVSKEFEPGEIIQYSLISFLLCGLVFSMVLYKKGNLCLEAKEIHELFRLNIATSFAFLGFYLSLIFIPPSISSLIEASSSPLWAVFFTYIYIKKLENNIPLLVLIFLFGLVTLSFSIESFNIKIFTGLTLSILAGAGAAYIATISNQGSMNDLSREKILAYRFYGSAICSAFLLYTTGGWNFDVYFLLKASVLSLLGFLLPMLLLQIGMEKTKPVITILCLSLIPLLSYISEMLLGSNFDLKAALMMTVTLFLTAYYIFSSTRKTVKEEGVVVR
ncbi:MULTISPECIES: EamA family transporter [unclassified Endozoicomonas]|uniref:EamA family transporter n=1 Tax=unclassified Endozoicomonas TaxID=2644528 RepID=UPI002148902E